MVSAYVSKTSQKRVYVGLSCSCIAFTRNGDAKAGSAGGVLLFLGVYLGKWATLAVQTKLGDAIKEFSDLEIQVCNGNFENLCKEYVALIMWLIAVIFGSETDLYILHLLFDINYISVNHAFRLL